MAVVDEGLRHEIEHEGERCRATLRGWGLTRFVGRRRGSGNGIGRWRSFAAGDSRRRKNTQTQHIKHTIPYI
jgi:hypothetical protein